MQLGGYANRVARIDLSAREINYEEIDEEDARKYIGGRGLGVKYVFDNGPDALTMVVWLSVPTTVSGMAMRRPSSSSVQTVLAKYSRLT